MRIIPNRVNINWLDSNCRLVKSRSFVAGNVIGICRKNEENGARRLNLLRRLSLDWVKMEIQNWGKFLSINSISLYTVRKNPSSGHQSPIIPPNRFLLVINLLFIFSSDCNSVTTFALSICLEFLIEKEKKKLAKNLWKFLPRNWKETEKNTFLHLKKLKIKKKHTKKKRAFKTVL